MDQKRNTLKLLGTAWVTPTVIAASIPAHAQTTGAFCGGMEGVAGYWAFKLDDVFHELHLYPNGSAVDHSDRAAKWSVNGSEIRVYDFEDDPDTVYLGEVDSSCTLFVGKDLSTQESFIATKVVASLP